VYWFICWWLGNPADPYSLSGYFGTALDIDVLGISHIYKGEGVPFDPEGLSSTLAAIVQVVFGFLVGQYIQQKGKNYEMLSNLFIAGSILIFAGFCWDMSFPINKKIWTSSFTLYTTGLATMVIGILIYWIEFKQVKGAWSKFFDVFGKNPLFIFVLSGFLPRLLALFRWVDHTNEDGSKVYTSVFPWFYNHICKNLAEDLRVGSLFYALCMISFYWLIVYVLDKKKIYIKV
jgi:predicted acyltransferase